MAALWAGPRVPIPHRPEQVRSGELHGRQREQGDSGRQSRARPGGPAAELRRTGRQSPDRDLRKLEGQESGERKEKTEWHSVVIFNENLAKVAEQYLKKGSKVYLEGQLQTRKWQDRPARSNTRPRSCSSASGAS